MDQKVFRKTIESLIDKQNRATWEAVLSAFDVSNKEDFFSLIEDESRMKENVKKFCEVVKITTTAFREYYIFLHNR